MLLLMTLNLDTIFDERKYADDLIDDLGFGWGNTGLPIVQF